MIRRHTIQQELVLNAVLRMQRHVTAAEVIKFIRKKHPTIGKSTIYRNLSFLAEEGVIRRIRTSHGSDVYECTLGEHHHIRCVDCGRLFNIEIDAIEDLCERVRNKGGFTFLGHDILFRGVCPSCQAKGKEDFQ